MNLRFSWFKFTIATGLATVLSTLLSCGIERSQIPPINQTMSPAGSSPSIPSSVPLSRQIEPAQAAPQPTAAPLPPETQAILSQLGDRPLFDPPRGDVRLVVISDLNSAYGSTDYDPEVDKGLALVPFWQPDLVVCGGDMVAGQQASLTVTEVRAMWGAFDDQVSGVLRRYGVPFGFTIGNHDASAAQSSQGNFIFQQERDLAREYWNNPKHDPGLTFVDRFEFPFYYTFEQQGIFFLVWDGSAATIPPEKLRWVEEALGSDRAQQAQMRVVLGHLPLYGIAKGRDKPGEVLANADELRALLEQYDVHTYISGHQHAYYPGHRGDLQLLHTGILGSGPRALIDGNQPPLKAITVVDIRFEDPDLTTYTTYNLQTLDLIEHQTLPRFLLGHNGRVLRRDVEWRDLTEAENNACEALLGASACTP
jgi:hypothetical protein